VSVTDGVRHRFTREEYALFDMPETGRTELLDGEVVNVSPMKLPHSVAVMNLVRLLTRRIDDECNTLGSQLPVALSDVSEPEPDVWVALGPPGVFATHKPTSEELALVIEVADSSYLFDRNRKLPLYATAAVPEVWIVDLNRDVVEVHCGPDGATYRSLVTVDRDGVLDLPWGGTLAAAEFLPPR
jgi:Uma2 family endonuclease